MDQTFSLVNDIIKKEKLPLSCRRAVLTILAEKGGQQDIRKCRLMSLLCSDYKILSKTLALWLQEVMLSIIHPDQTYCVMGWLISANVTLVSRASELERSKKSLISLISAKLGLTLSQNAVRVLDRWRNTIQYGNS